MNNSINSFLRIVPTPKAVEAQKVEQKATEQAQEAKQAKAQAETTAAQQSHNPETLQHFTANLAVFGQSLVKDVRKKSDDTDQPQFPEEGIDIGGMIFDSRDQIEDFVNNPANQKLYYDLKAKQDAQVLELV